jgi:hypothetical protein
MTMIARDLMIGNPRLAELGFGEEAPGRNAIVSRQPAGMSVERGLWVIKARPFHLTRA